MRPRTTPIARELIDAALCGELDKRRARRLAELGPVLERALEKIVRTQGVA